MNKLAEQIVRAQAFDSLVEATTNTLRDPVVSLMIGDIATELTAIIASAYLPDYRHGRWHVPRSQRNSMNLAIVPVSDQEATGSYASMIAPLLDDYPLSWPLLPVNTSALYGIDVSGTELMETLAPQEETSVSFS